MAYVGLTLNYLVHDHGQLKLCQITGYMTYFFSMASFFWLNVMCVDIYITFSGFLRRTSERTCQKLCLFAWSVPLFLTTTTAILDCVAEDQWFSPGIGQYSCWFANKKSEFLLFHGPVLFLLLINCHLFCVTALKLRRERRDAVRALHDEDTRVFGRFGQRLRLYAKLFLLMGCTWFLEIISWAVGGPPEVWYLPDAINGLRGVFIFWFCVWSNANTRVLLRDRFDSILDKVKNRFLM
ncbi:probable G-protein coupled receptor Mth-like 1 [Cloeon dipterum]|uniref:probable G-protein coupled receptor Mth-like 1 n=1 Tax=Cloeon dipterum TaxID=197152 RepID=UPI0032202754